MANRTRLPQLPAPRRRPGPADRLRQVARTYAARAEAEGVAPESPAAQDARLAAFAATYGDNPFGGTAAKGDEMATAQDVSDIERAAVTMLVQVKAGHPVLQWWIDRIAADPEYLGLSPVGAPPEYLDSARADGWVAVDGKELVRLAYNHATIPDDTSNPALAGSLNRTFYGWRHRIVASLAGAIISHRVAGRPAGDVRHLLHDGPVLTTSLAAVVAECGGDLIELAVIMLDAAEEAARSR